MQKCVIIHALHVQILQKHVKNNYNNFFCNMVSVCYKEKASLFLKKIFFIYYQKIMLISLAYSPNKSQV